MDLKNNEITVAALLSNPKARAVLNREFPGVVDHPMIRYAHGFTLAQVLQMVGGRMDPHRIRRILEELAAL